MVLLRRGGYGKAVTTFLVKNQTRGLWKHHLRMLITLAIIIIVSSVLFADAPSILYAESSEWENFIVVGDVFRTEFYYKKLDSLRQKFMLEGIHNSIQAWIDYIDNGCDIPTNGIILVI